MKLADVVSEMRSLVTSKDSLGPVARSRRVFEMADAFLLQALVRDQERGQVAIFMIDPGHGQLTFAHPKHLSYGNTIPLDRNSIAGRVATDLRVFVDNRVPDEPHKDFFERIPDVAGRVRPIQKMAAAPIVDRQGRLLGVVEVSRTGLTAAEAGPDFSARDGENLAKSCQAFAPFFAHAWKNGRG